jgi:hypothetical protein
MTLPAGLTATAPSPFTPVLEVETQEHEAAWRESVVRSTAAYHAARVCWNCHERWTEAGACPTKGCRGPGSGFERLAPRPVQPCLRCGALTNRWAVAELLIVGRRSEFGWNGITWCEACERARNLAQAERCAANPDVLPHIRERCAAWTAELSRVAA